MTWLDSTWCHFGRQVARSRRSALREHNIYNLQFVTRQHCAMPEICILCVQESPVKPRIGRVFQWSKTPTKSAGKHAADRLSKLSLPSQMRQPQNMTIPEIIQDVSDGLKHTCTGLFLIVSRLISESGRWTRATKGSLPRSAPIFASTNLR